MEIHIMHYGGDHENEIRLESESRNITQPLRCPKSHFLHHSLVILCLDAKTHWCRVIFYPISPHLYEFHMSMFSRIVMCLLHVRSQTAK